MRPQWPRCFALRVCALTLSRLSSVVAAVRDLYGGPGKLWKLVALDRVCMLAVASPATQRPSRHYRKLAAHGWEGGAL